MSTTPGSTQQFLHDLVETALLYASADFPVFPLHSPKKKGLCDCPQAEACESPAKHPRTLKGFKDAVCDEATIRRWWGMWPRANIGLAIPTGYAVLDIDGQTGIDALTQHGYWLPETPLATTGKGWHYWFRTQADLSPRANMLPKVDLRGPGSYIVVPPSLHVSGVQYRWQLSMTEVEIKSVPDWLIELAGQSHGFSTDTHTSLDVENLFLNGISEGERDATLFRVASKLRAIGIPQDVAEGVISALAERCQPPFEYVEAMKKVQSAYMRYEPGTWTWTPETSDPRLAEWQGKTPHSLDDIPEVSS